jgi:hypothetical protein
MTVSIADAFDKIRSEPPVTVILVDTCTFLDLFRSDATKPRVPHQEIQAAADLLELLNVTPPAAHLIVPELVPREYADHAGALELSGGLQRAGFTNPRRARKRLHDSGTQVLHVPPRRDRLSPRGW